MHLRVWLQRQIASQEARIQKGICFGRGLSAVSKHRDCDIHHSHWNPAKPSRSCSPGTLEPAWPWTDCHPNPSWNRQKRPACHRPEDGTTTKKLAFGLQWSWLDSSTSPAKPRRRRGKGRERRVKGGWSLCRCVVRWEACWRGWYWGQADNTGSVVQCWAWTVKKTLLACNVFVIPESQGTLSSLWFSRFASEALF